MASSFSFAALAKASAAQLHRKRVLVKEIKIKLSLIIEMSSKIQATSNEHVLLEFNKSTNSVKLHSNWTLEKLKFWQKSNAFLITQAIVHRAFSFFFVLSV